MTLDLRTDDVDVELGLVLQESGLMFTPCFPNVVFGSLLFFQTITLNVVNRAANVLLVRFAFSSEQVFI